MLKTDLHAGLGKRDDSKNLTRDDFDGGPISLDEVEPKLWLGNVTAAKDNGTLKSHNITHILTVDSCPLPTHVTQIPGLVTKFVHASDITKEDLLSHFEECINFITEALAAQKTILVHCYFGVSRSASIVIAYLMKTHCINYETAFTRIKSKRRFVGPNTGFISQLKLFHKMGCKIDKSHDKYKLYRLRLAADSIKKAKILPNQFMDLVKSDPGLIQIRPEPIVYRCRKCRRVVASRSNLITHKSKDSMENDPKPIVIDNLVEKMRGNSLNSETSNKSTDSGRQQQQQHCQKMFFVEPIAWMKEILSNTQGKLYCPKCQSKLGSFSWVMGCSCPCGHQVSPAFYLVPSRVEYSTVVQNVQVTV